MKKIAHNNRYMLKQLIADNPDYFSKGNKRFFNDKQYFFYYSTSGNPYLVRSTYAWTDMFNSANKYLHYRINEIKEIDGKYKPSNLLDNEFKTLADVKNWLAEK